MKLRNKKTGEIVIKHLVIKGNNEVAKIYNSLAELNAEWEDAPEEPKEWWYIDEEGIVHSENIEYFQDEQENYKEIGNYFRTEEEAEKAVEKLKAIKRLKDNHFKILNVKDVTPDVPIDEYYLHIEATFDTAGLDDVKLLFGDEE